MATKYILQPNGNIIPVNEEGTLEQAFDPANPVANNTVPAFSEEVVENNSSTFSSDEKINDFYEINIDDFNVLDDENIFNENKILAPVSNDKSFNFINNDGQVKEVQDTIQSFKPFNSYKESDQTVFADEFEILSGLRLREGENKTTQQTAALFLYLTESITRVALIEAIVLLNNTAHLELGYHNVSERFQLRIGKYDFTEYDVFTKYVFNVLNYPHSKSTTAERLAAYFIGFAEWLTPDSAIDYNEIIKEISNSENLLDLSSTFFTGGKKNVNVLTYLLIPVVVATAEIVVASALNNTSNKRLDLLLRKFYKESYWHQNKLFNAKPKNDYLDAFTTTNYYYFKFYIERVHVGLNILKRSVFDDSYLSLKQKDSAFNRVSASSSPFKMKFEIAFSDNSEEMLLIAPDLITAIKDENKENDRPAALPSAADNALSALGISTEPKDTKSLVYNWSNQRSDREDLGGKIIKKPGSTTRLRSLPQLFTMHKSLYKAIVANGNKTTQTIDIHSSIKQNFYDNNYKRIPDNIVKEIENILEAEYMPFYFHDLRTNEILAFHAFIDSITDSFNPEYSSASGFGRIDDVRSYIKTTRNINLSFTIAATSEIDHDMMWYQINKIVAMVYPQWSDGFQVKKLDSEGNVDPKIDFKYPFTQVPTASPLIRLRVGDVIKSNYSRANLSRLFGVGERSFDDKNTFEHEDDTVAYLMAGQYKASTDSAGIGLGLGGSVSLEAIPKVINLDHEVKIIKIDEEKENDKFVTVSIKNPYFLIKETDAFSLPAGLLELENISLQVDASKIMHVKKTTLTAEGESNSKAKELMRAFENEDNPNATSKNNNPITRAYESGMSRGLAGFITQLDVNYNEVNWDTSRIGSKAPMLVKITVNFAPIHDIPPGLDHNGMLRAPVYNVGRLNNQLFGDPHDKNYIGEGRDKALKKYELLKGLDKK